MDLWAEGSSLELEYSSKYSIGTGVSSEKGTYKANPFAEIGEITQSETVELDEIKRFVIKSAYD